MSGGEAVGTAGAGRADICCEPLALQGNKPVQHMKLSRARGKLLVGGCSHVNLLGKLGFVGEELRKINSV